VGKKKEERRRRRRDGEGSVDFDESAIAAPIIHISAENQTITTSI
jgi:hypothetical protein